MNIFEHIFVVFVVDYNMTILWKLIIFVKIDGCFFILAFTLTRKKKIEVKMFIHKTIFFVAFNT